MMNIKIKRLALENFKCHKSLTLEFNGCNASIYGDNAAGKTSVYDALTWLLFGKDSKGNGEKNIEIKPLDANGEVLDHLAETAVEAVLVADGEEITLRRTLKEIWTTKRGRTEQTYDGNTSEYFIDGVPVKKYAFSEKVDQLVSEDTFRLLTSVSHFADGITWQDRRAVLFKVAAVSDDAHIMASDERFLPLIEGMGKLSVEDYKKKLTAEKRGFVADKTESNLELTNIQVEQGLKDFELNVVRMVRQFNLQAQYMEIAAKKARTADRRFEVAKRLYLLGKSTVLDLNAAITEKDSSLRSYVSSLQTYWSLYYGLRSMTGYDFERNMKIEENFPEL